NTAHPTFTHVFMPYKFTDDEAAQASIKSFNAQLFKSHLGEIERMAQAMSAAGRAFLFGDSYGPADAYALTLLRWGGFAGHDPQQFPALWAHVRKIAQLPAVARAIERERLQLNVYKAA
ncbi:MAG TPA: glutathione binding-like protein, partial [Ramlibacter sp.]